MPAATPAQLESFYLYPKSNPVCKLHFDKDQFHEVSGQRKAGEVPRHKIPVQACADGRPRPRLRDSIPVGSAPITASSIPRTTRPPFRRKVHSAVKGLQDTLTGLDDADFTAGAQSAIKEFTIEVGVDVKLPPQLEEKDEEKSDDVVQRQWFLTPVLQKNSETCLYYTGEVSWEALCGLFEWMKCCGAMSGMRSIDLISPALTRGRSRRHPVAPQGSWTRSSGLHSGSSCSDDFDRI